MTGETKTYSQIFDDGIRGRIVAQIGEKVFVLIVVLAAFADEHGVCYPPEDQLTRLIGVSERTIRNRIRAAERVLHNGVPVLTVKLNRKRKGKALLYDNNIYTISRSLRADLITRYYSTGKYLPPENMKQSRAQTEMPSATLSPVKKLPHNDSHSLNQTIRNEKAVSPLKKDYKPKTSLADFKEALGNREDGWLFYIAEWLGERNMDFLLAARSDPKCGMRGIEWAYNRTKEDCGRSKVRNKGRYFNGLIGKYKKGDAEK